MWRLRSQFVAILTLAMLPAGVLSVVQAMSTAEERLREEAAEVWAAARVRAVEDRDVFVRIRERLRAAAQAAVRIEGEPRTCEQAIAWVENAHPSITRAMIVDAEGRSVCGPPSPLSVAGLAEWAEFRAHPGFSVGAARIGRITGQPVSVAYYPIPDNAIGLHAFAVGIELSFLEGLADASASATRSAALIGNGGAVLASAGPVADDVWLPADPARLLGGDAASHRLAGRDGTERLYASFPLVPGQLWSVSATPAVTLGALLFTPHAIAIATPVVLWLIAIAVAILAIQHLVTRHVGVLQRAAARIGAGERDVSLGRLAEAPVEIHRLAGSIERMAARITEREDRLRDLLSAQKSLLLEVNHRVKNNLQMISSLVNIQLRRAGSERERRTLQLVQDRIHGLALVHQNLYATERLDHVALDQLVRELAGHLATSLKPPRTEVDIGYTLEPVTVGAGIATPVALFVTEAMANVFKHALREGRPQRIAIALTAEGERFSLTVENRDVGGAGAPDLAPADPAPDNGPSGMGLRLMEGFARQLGGEFLREEEPGLYRVGLSAPVQEPGEFSIRHDPREGGSGGGAGADGEADDRSDADSAGDDPQAQPRPGAQPGPGPARDTAHAPGDGSELDDPRTDRAASG